MATAGSTIAKLLDESRELEARTQVIQVERELLVDPVDIDKVVSDYLKWFARAINVLPSEYEDRFRHEYDGNWHSRKIKSFFASPGEVSLLWSEEVADSPIPYWGEDRRALRARLDELSDPKPHMEPIRYETSLLAREMWSTLAQQAAADEGLEA